jgi:protease-4
MKSFFKIVLATMLGFLVSQVVLVILLVLFIVGLAMSGSDSGSQEIEPHSILHLRLDQPLVERSSKNPLQGFDWASFEDNSGMPVSQMLIVLKQAAQDKNIDGVFLDLTTIEGDMTQQSRVRRALEDFKRSGKFIMAHAESYTQGTLLMASMAKPITMAPQGMAMFNGLALEPVFLKGMFDKLDMEIDLIRVGKYKSAGEMLIRENMSEENRYQQTQLLEGIYKEMLSGYSQNLKISSDSLRALANGGLIRNAKTSVTFGLIDSLMYRDQVLEWLKNRTKAKAIDKLKLVTASEYFASLDAKVQETIPGMSGGSDESKERIAVIYAEGDIVSGEGGDGQMGSDRITEALRKARLDKNIKAVVLRINSPGGSALASDLIWRETKMIRQAGKPLVVSMGGVAASGGYYIAAAADSIFAAPTTITGSIGVFGLAPYVGDFMRNKLGITVDRVTTGPYGDIMSLSRRMRPDERAIVQAGVDEIYETFVGIVSEGRRSAGQSLSRDSVHALAQGRVYTGRQAMAIGLVDRMGDLDDAIACAAQLAKVTKFRLRELPDQEDPFEKILDQMTTAYTRHQMQNELGPLYTPYNKVKHWVENPGIQARLDISYPRGF